MSCFKYSELGHLQVECDKDFLQKHFSTSCPSTACRDSKEHFKHCPQFQCHQQVQYHRLTNDTRETSSWVQGGSTLLHQMPSRCIPLSPLSRRVEVPRDHLWWHLLWEGAPTLQGLPIGSDRDTTHNGKCPFHPVWWWGHLPNSNW